jgi:hypothetical protein
MDVVGECECGHDAKMHENIDGRIVAVTPCGGEVFGPTSMSGNIVRTLKCSCNSYSAKETVLA